jgi:hypothetical protein
MPDMVLLFTSIGVGTSVKIEEVSKESACLALAPMPDTVVIV